MTPLTPAFVMISMFLIDKNLVIATGIVELLKQIKIQEFNKPSCDPSFIIKSWSYFANTKS
jgi:hypothetical protein